MRWHSAHALSSNDLVNLMSGRIIERIIENQRVPLPQGLEGEYLDFAYTIKLVGVDSYIGFKDDCAYILRYFRPV